MKKLLLLVAVMAGPCSFAQFTHMVDWFMGVGTEETTITVNTGDTVTWTWIGGTHTVTSGAGSTETFESAILSGAGSTFSHTFNQTGVNPYFCTIHPMMTGTITVEALSTSESAMAALRFFPNPVKNQLHISAPATIDRVAMFDVSGKKVWEANVNTAEAIIYMSNYEAGIYIVEVQSAGKINRHKVVKE